MSVIQLDIFAGDDPNGSVLVTLTDELIASFEMRVGENELGAGKFTIRRDVPEATDANLAGGNFVKVRIPIIDPDDYSFGFWIDEHSDTILAQNEEGAEVLERGGPGALWALGFARFLDDIYAPAPPASPHRGSANEIPGFWRWQAQPYGAILKRFIEEGQNEPGIPLDFVTTDFDRDDDSDGTPWPPIVRDVRFPIGTDGLQLFEAFAQTGELYMRSSPDLLISARQARGVDRTWGGFTAGKVRFEKGVNIQTELVRAGHGTRAATHAIVLGTDNTYVRRVSPDYTSGPGRWATVNYEESNDDEILEKVGDTELARRDADQQALEFEIRAGDDPGAGFYLPFKHFNTGDLCTLHTDAGLPSGYDESTHRISGFRIVLGEVSDDATPELAAASLHVVVELGGAPQSPAALSVTPQQSGCNCPCSLGEEVPDTFRPAYYGEVYGPTNSGVSDGSGTQNFSFMDGSGTTSLGWVLGTLMVFVDGVMIPGDWDLGVTGITASGDVYMYGRVACPDEEGGGG